MPETKELLFPDYELSNRKNRTIGDRTGLVSPGVIIHPGRTPGTSGYQDVQGNSGVFSSVIPRFFPSIALAYTMRPSGTRIFAPSPGFPFIDPAYPRDLQVPGMSQMVLPGIDPGIPHETFSYPDCPTIPLFSYPFTR
jgi:hypothetical protein